RSSAKREWHLRAVSRLAIERNNAIRDAAHSENRGLRRRDDGVERIHVVHAEIGDRKCAAAYIGRSQPSVTRAIGQFLPLRRDLSDAGFVGIRNYCSNHTI